MESPNKRLKVDEIKGLVDECYPEVYGPAAMPPQPKELKPGQLEEEKIRHFFEKGYLLIPDYFKKEQLEACKKDIEKLVDDLANKLYKAGKIKITKRLDNQLSIAARGDLHHKVITWLVAVIKGEDRRLIKGQKPVR